MSEASRQRYLHVKNRLEELAWKYGPLDPPPTPDWLDSLEGWHAYKARIAAQNAPETASSGIDTQPAAPPQPAQKRVLRRPARSADW